MATQVIAEGNVLAPQKTVFLDQMQMVGPGYSLAEELPAWHTSLATMLVPGALEGQYVVPRGSYCRPSRKDVEHRLCAGAWDRRAADVLESHRQRTTLLAYSPSLDRKQRRPPVVVLDEAHETGLETERGRLKLRLILMIRLD
jgi:hypothetical protein